MPALLPENTSPDLRGSTLAPKEPYHVPGYAGYRPQYKFQCSETFGNTTNRLLASADVRKSSNSVLRPIDPPRSRTVPLGFHDVPKLEGDQFDIGEILESRRSKWGDQLFKPDMRSGYMGFVPKAHFSSYHSKTFPQICNTALKDFTEDQANHKDKARHLRDTMRMQESGGLVGSQRNVLLTSTKLPLYSIRSTMRPYVSSSTHQRHDSPYFLPDEHPHKHFRSGFAGHVPFYKDLGGHGYPIVTNQALREFTKERKRILSSVDQPLSPAKIGVPYPPVKSVSFPGRSSKQNIFLVDSGIIPRYAGYVPGQKFRFGQTFGHSTENPLNVKVESPKVLSILS
ncbi:unnamed protein product [Clavelina lepadiformis]|uniref:Ciliary microtubule inner protein 2B n=1 Tax=Clavelina lepadiformis TaxID=159417 RepID=A0ABP0GC99_CLALP